MNGVAPASAIRIHRLGDRDLDDAPRYERKFIVERTQRAPVVAQILRLPERFRRAHPSREINNIYLDDPGFGDYRANVEGFSRRMKLRVRWYGPRSALVESPRLECKLKRAHEGRKVSEHLPAFVFDGRFDLRASQRLLACLSPELRVLVARRRPVLVNRYRRDYFASADGRLRITVDSHLEFGRFRISAESPRLYPAFAGTVILEAKYGVHDDASARAATARLPWRPGRFSKYVEGIRQVYGLPPPTPVGPGGAANT